MKLFFFFFGIAFEHGLAFWGGVVVGRHGDGCSFVPLRYDDTKRMAGRAGVFKSNVYSPRIYNLFYSYKPEGSPLRALWHFVGDRVAMSALGLRW